MCPYKELQSAFIPFIASERMRYTPARLAPLERDEPQKHVAFDFGFIDFVEKLMPRVIVFFDGEVFCAVFPVDRTEFFYRFAVAADGIGTTVDY